jgi:tetratricopeptide (TPR) repeat protein
MAKQQRRGKSAKTNRPGATTRKAKPAAKMARKPVRSPAALKAAPPKARTRTGATTRLAPREVPKATVAPAEPPAPPPPPRKPGFYEAVAVYERGVQALQRHDFRAAAEFFRAVLDRYPDERELLERARLYLRVCERETARQPQEPRTPEERVYAATMALNAGDPARALDHLQRALTEAPDSDHAHYTMAVVLGMRGRAEEALDHLRNAIGLNPENRSLARQDPDLESLRGHDGFRAALETAPFANRRTRQARR